MLIFLLTVESFSKPCITHGIPMRMPAPDDHECLILKINRTDPIPADVVLDDKQLKVVKQHLRLINELIKNYTVYKEIKLVPFVKWAQNMSHIFVVWKLSHRWDSPPCLDTVSQDLDYPQTNRVNFSQECLMGNEKYLFNLDLTLARPVENMETKKEGFTWVLKARKVFPEVWPSLTQNSNSPMWLQMAQKYPQQTRQYEQLQEKIKVEQKRRKKRRQQDI